MWILKEIIPFIRKIIGDKVWLLGIYSLFLITQFVILFLLLGKFEAIYFVSLTFTLLFMFMVLAGTFVSVSLSIVFIWIVVAKSLSSILLWVLIWILLVIIGGILYLVSEKHYFIVEKQAQSFFKYYLWSVWGLWFIIFLYFFILFFRDILQSPTPIVIETSSWIIDDYKLRFYNVDYYFLENSSWSIDIFDNSEIKKITFQ